MKTNSSAPQTLYLGLDVHKAETVIAILESDRDAEPRHYGSIATTQHALERVMHRIGKSQNRQLSDLHVCYEASGCGFWIARRLLQMGVRCEVIAPSLTPPTTGSLRTTSPSLKANHHHSTFLFSKLGGETHPAFPGGPCKKKSSVAKCKLPRQADSFKLEY